MVEKVTDNLGKPVIQYFTIAVIIYFILVALYIALNFLLDGLFTFILAIVIAVLTLILFIAAFYRLFTKRTLIKRYSIKYYNVAEEKENHKNEIKENKESKENTENSVIPTSTTNYQGSQLKLDNDVTVPKNAVEEKLEEIPTLTAKEDNTIVPKQSVDNNSTINNSIPSADSNPYANHFVTSTVLQGSNDVNTENLLGDVKISY